MEIKYTKKHSQSRALEVKCNQICFDTVFLCENKDENLILKSLLCLVVDVQVVGPLSPYLHLRPICVASFVRRTRWNISEYYWHKLEA